MDLSPFLYGVYKFLKYAVYPYTWMVLLSGLLTVSVLKRASAFRLLWIRLLTLSMLAVMLALGSPLVARLLAASLEEQYAPFDQSSAKHFDVIVALGGGIYPKGSLRPSDTLTYSSALRTFCAADLVLRGYGTTVLFSGGDGSIIGEGPEEAVEMKRLAIRLGVPEEKIRLETRSRTTYEGAVEVKQMVGGQSILLVTSAGHLPRSIALFRGQGLNVTPYPCGYSARHRTDSVELTVFDFLPRIEALQISTDSIVELVGMWMYRVLGKV